MIASFIRALPVTPAISMAPARAAAAAPKEASFTFAAMVEQASAPAVVTRPLPAPAKPVEQALPPAVIVKTETLPLAPPTKDDNARPVETPEKADDAEAEVVAGSEVLADVAAAIPVPAPKPEPRSAGVTTSGSASGGTKRKTEPKSTGPARAAEAPYIGIPVALPIPPAPVRSAPDEHPGGEQPVAAPATAPQAPEKPETAPRPDVALQVNIKMPTAPAPAAPIPDPAVLKQQVLPVAPEVAIIASAPGPTSTATATAPVAAHPASLPPRTTEQTTHTAPVPPAEPEPKETAAQPLKSVTLEFAPDNAGDVKLRISERAGEVHISLHSSDASLGGKLHEGVHDLVGSLSRAGFEAEAWTPGHDQQGNQGNQGSQHRQEERRQPAANPEDPDAEEFSGVFAEQTIQEVS